MYIVQVMVPTVYQSLVYGPEVDADWEGVYTALQGESDTQELDEARQVRAELLKYYTQARIVRTLPGGGTVMV